ncbi:MAG: tyrosine-type recombinase/integrase [Akkermansia sp.]|nr:tyrosine-type recombinase/integrase [Akkermansia sp.]
MKIELTENEIAALALLKSSGVEALEAAQVACRALKIGRGRVKRTLRCLTEGEKALRQQERTVSFQKAVEAALEARRERRVRTVDDFRYFTRRFMKRCPGMARRKVRAITPQECAQYIEQAFDTPRQRQKARLILSGVFGTAVKRGWCSENPVAKVEVPRVVEKQVPILSPQEISDLKQTAASYRGGSCAAAVGMMLYAGIRPHEVARLSWEQVDLQERAIYVMPQHSKTGGARRVTIHKPLLRILRAHRRADAEKICPPDWLRHWRELRKAAGWDSPAHPWPQDALRHTFASYHLSHFRSFAELQLEIGHRDATLLRTRYVDQRGVHSSAQFWAA